MGDIGKVVGDLAMGLAHQRRMTHAGIVIATAAILEAQLERALTRAMRPLSKKLYERVFDSFGPLSTFSSKIVMAHCLGIISAPVFQNLEHLRKLRNAFAHSSELLHFGSPQILPLFQALGLPATSTTEAESALMEFAKVIDRILEEYLARMGERSA